MRLLTIQSNVERASLVIVMLDCWNYDECMLAIYLVAARVI